MAELITKKQKLNLKAYHHVASYPVLEETADYAVSFSFVKLLADQASSTLHQLLAYLSSFELVVSYWNYIDATLEGWLSSLDGRIPILKSASFQSAYKGVQDYYNSIIASISAKLSSLSKSVQPAADRVIKFFDPVLKVTNDYYEYVLNLILPYSKQLEADLKEAPETVRTQYQRTLSLFGETYHRLSSTASNVSKIPSHVTTTYKNELKESTSTTQAVSKTTRKLSNDAYQTIKPTLDRVVGVGNNAATSTIDKVEPVVGELKDSIAHATGVEVH